jgi:hypothetical protein
LCRQPDDFECPEEIIPSSEQICEVEGLVLATEEECRQEDCQTINFSGVCGHMQTVLCREQEDQCLDFPSCPSDTLESPHACLRGEQSCTDVTLCGQTISCRPTLICDAYPTCQNDDSTRYYIFILSKSSLTTLP